jgi:predicted amidohydrolase YtcJ
MSIAICVLAACSPLDTPGVSPTADAVYTNARIYTVNAVDGWASAMAVADGRIIAIGVEADVARHIGDATVVEDLGGRMVLPGIQDTHLHAMDGGITKTLECSFLTNSLQEALHVLKGCLADLPSGEWLRGGQWNEGLFAGSDRQPREILDEIAPDHPVFLMDWSVHNAWVNSLALAYLGIDDDTPDPAGGVIVRDRATGQATGILLDNAAYKNKRRLPVHALEQRVNALAWSVERIAGYGITTFKEAIATTETLETLRALEQRGELPINVKTSLSWKSEWARSHEAEVALIDARDEFESAKLDTGYAKIMLDGIPPTYTAAMLEPYLPNEAFGDDWRGKLIFPPEEVRDDVVALDARGLSVKIHATGDRSARVALDAFEAARRINGDSGLVHEVSHAELIHPDDVPRFAELNVAAEMCPILWYPIDGLDWEAWLGPERKVWPTRDLVEAGALVTYGSDWPVVPLANPWPGLEAMVTRADPAGATDATLWGDQAIDLATAVRIFTYNGAVANGDGETSGSLEVGKDADFIVLDRNIFEVPVADVGETRVLMSVVAGEEIFRLL